MKLNKKIKTTGANKVTVFTQLKEEVRSKIYLTRVLKNDLEKWERKEYQNLLDETKRNIIILRNKYHLIVV